MTLSRNTLSSGTNGATLANPLASDGYAFVTAGLTYSAVNAGLGKMCAITAADTTAGYFKATGLSITSCALSVYLMVIGTVPTSDLHVFNILTGGATRVASIHINSAGKLRLSDASGTTGVWTATNALVAGHIYRLEMGWATGSSSSTGTLTCDYYDCGTLDAFIETTTPVQTGYASTTANVGSGTAASDIYIGKRSNVAFQLALSAPAFNDGTTTAIGPYLRAAATPCNPFAVRSNAGSYTLTGTGVNKIGALAQGSGDADYVTNLGSAADELLNVAMGELATGSIVKVNYRAWLPSGSTATKLKVKVYQGATLIHTDTRSTSDATNPLSATPQLYTATIDSSLITDRKQLRCELDLNAA